MEDYTLPLELQKRIAWAALRNYYRALRKANDHEAIIDLRNGLRGFDGVINTNKRTVRS